MLIPFPFNLPLLIVFTILKYTFFFIYEFLSRSSSPIGTSLKIPGFLIEKISE